MNSLQGVPSSLILRNESWVRKHANSLARHLPSNVERADLIQVGLIAVAQAALGFEWEGDRDSEEARQAFVRYAQHRVHGAMLDELRQMDHLTRDQRRKVKLVQVARERWRSGHEGEARAADLSQLCGLSVDEIFQLEALAQHGQSLSEPEQGDEEAPARRSEPATEQDEVEARVDTAILMRRLKVFFDALPERDRQVIDAYLGVGLTPGQLAQNLNVTPSRLSQMFKSLCQRIGVNLGTTPAPAPAPVPAQRASDRVRGARGKALDDLVAEREAQSDGPPASGAAWGRRLQEVLVQPPAGANPERIVVDGSTRWG